MNRAAPLALLAAGLAAGCTRPQAEPPLLSLGDRVCDSRPVFGGAVPVLLDQSVGVIGKLGMQGRCLKQPGAPSTTYAVFALPPLSAPATLTISSLAGDTLVQPRAALYDAAGTAIRTLPPDEFRTEVIGFQTGLRLHGGERWLLVAADSAKLGQPVTLHLGDNDDGRIRTAAVVLIYVPPPTLPDVTRTRQTTYGLNGTIHVTLTSVWTSP